MPKLKNDKKRVSDKGNDNKFPEPTLEQVWEFGESLNENRPPELTFEDIKQSIVKFHLENRDNPITLEEIKRILLYLDNFITKPGLNEIALRNHVFVNWHKNPKLFSIILSHDPEFLFREPAKTLVLAIYQKYLHGDARERNKAKDWLGKALIPEKRGRESNVKRARKYEAGLIAEMCWHLWGYFQLIKNELEVVEKKSNREDTIIEILLKIRPDLPRNSSWKNKYVALLRKKKNAPGISHIRNGLPAIY